MSEDTETDVLAEWLARLDARELAAVLEARPRLQRYAIGPWSGLREVAADILGDTGNTGLLHTLTFAEQTVLSAMADLMERSVIVSERAMPAMDWRSYRPAIAIADLVSAVAPSAPGSRSAVKVIEDLLAKLLLLPAGEQTVRASPLVQRHAGRCRANSGFHRRDDLDPPRVPVVNVSADQVLNEAETAVVGVLTKIEMLLVELAERPAALRRTGDLGVRELRRLVKLLQMSEDYVALLIDLAFAVDLLGVAALNPHEPGQQLLATTGYEQWLTLPPAERLAPFIMAWLAMPMVPTWPLERVEDTVTPGEGRDTCAAGLRYAVLATLADIPPGHCAAVGRMRRPGHASGIDDLIHAVKWRRPACVPGQYPDTKITAILAEAEILGLVALGALTPAGRAAVAALPPCGCPQSVSEDAYRTLVSVLTGLFPVVQVKARFLGDMTAVVAGIPAPDLAILLDSAADRESRGIASTWRFTIDSMVRALNSLDAGDLERKLRAAAQGPVPQPLTVMINDAARKRGQIQVMRVGSCIRCDDPLLVVELTNSTAPSLRPLQLRQIAPTILISAQSPASTLRALRDARYAASPPDDTGILQFDAQTPRRAEPRASKVVDLASRRSAESAQRTPLELALRLLQQNSGTQT